MDQALSNLCLHAELACEPVTVIAPPKRAHILIVEDNVAIREVLTEILEEEGHTVSQAGDGLQALKLLEAGAPRPDLILLDLMMPNMNGFEFRERQLMNSAFSAIPVAVITAAGQARDKAEQLQPVGFLRKPIKIQELLDVVNRLAK